MEKVLKIYDYSNTNIIRVSISEPKFSERYRYYYNYTRKVKNCNNYYGDMRLNYPGFLKDNKKRFNLLNCIKRFLGLKIKEVKDSNEKEFTEETYRNVLVESCCQRNNNWIFNSFTTIYKEDENFFMNDEYISLSTSSNPILSRIIFRFHDTSEDNTDSDIDGNTWVNLDEVYKVEITKKESNNSIMIDTIYFTDKEDLDKFLNWIQKYILKDSLIINDSLGKIESTCSL